MEDLVKSTSDFSGKSVVQLKIFFQSLLLKSEKCTAMHKVHDSQYLNSAIVPPYLFFITLARKIMKAKLQDLKIFIIFFFVIFKLLIQETKRNARPEENT